MIHSLFATVKDTKKVKIYLEIHYIMTLYSVITIVLLGIIVACSCVYTFDCKEFIPTISYLLHYRSYDRLITFTLAFGVFPLLVFFICGFITYRKYINAIDSYSLLIIGLVFSFMVPGVALIDEISGLLGVSVNKLQVLVFEGLLGVVCVWMLFSLEWLYKLNKNSPSIMAKFSCFYVLLCYTSLFWYYYLQNTHENSFYARLALSEYVSITLIVFLPRVYSSNFENLKISIGKYS
jgi:hypothetical protein